MSPTISRAARLGTASSSARMSMTSTIEASSTTSRSQSSGLLALRLKLPVAGSISSSRWMVRASCPVVSASFPQVLKIRTACAVPTPWPSRNTTISRTACCSAQASVMQLDLAVAELSGAVSLGAGGFSGAGTLGGCCPVSGRATHSALVW